MRVLIAMIVFTSFFGASFLSIDLGNFQLTPFRIALIMLLLLTFVKSLTHKHRISSDITQIRKPILNDKRVQFLIIWLIYDIITVLWVKDYIRWGKSIIFIGVGLISAIVLSVFLRDDKDFINVFKIIEAASIVYNIFGWYEVITGNYLFYEPRNSYIIDLWRIQNKRIPVFIASNENEFAILLILMFFVSYVLAKHRKSKMFSMIILISDISLIFLSQSRGAIMALLLGIITLIWLRFKELSKYKRYNGIRILLITLVFGVIILFTYLWASDIISLKFYEGGSDLFRVQLLFAGIKFLVETFFMGVGGGNIEYWMCNYAPELSGGMYANVHSWWAEILVSYGLIIFILYLLYYFGMYSEIVRRSKTETNKTRKSINRGLIGYMISFLITSMVSSSLLRVEWLWLFWGILIAYLYNYENVDNVSNTAVES